MIREVERDRRFAQLVRESAQRVLAFKNKIFSKKSVMSRRRPAPTSARMEKLSRQLWEFEEEIHLATFARIDNKNKKDRA
jgi:hypothetical protein